MTPAPHLRTREVVRGLPNFRDHGRTVDRPLLDLIARLQKRYGESFASEAGLRRMMFQDTGHMPGLDTIRRALRRLERQGLLEQLHLLPGGVLPDGSACTHGTRLVHLPQCRKARRALRASATQGRVNRRALSTLVDVRNAVAARAAPPVDERELAARRKRQEDLARLGELAAQWQEPDVPQRE